MATLATRNLSIADAARRLDPDGKVAKIVEVLNQSHEILDDAVVREANDGSKHKSTIRTGIPVPTWRKLYGGVLPTKSATAQVTDSCGMMAALTKVDADLVDMSSDKAGTLLSEQLPQLEGMRQEAERVLFYGDTQANPEQYHGLAARYSVKNTTNDETISPFNVLTAAGAGADNTSVWLIGWGDSTCHLIYPQNSSVGISQENKGKILTAQAEDHSLGEFDAYVSQYKWNLGLAIRDWRSVGRICNIDISDLEGSTGSQNAQQLLKLMIQLEERVMHYGGLGAARFSWVMHPRVRAMLRTQFLDKQSGNFTFENVMGKRVMMFGETPIRVSRQISLAEAAL